MQAHAKRVLLWLLLGASIGVACGASSAAFLASLELVTQLRVRHPGVVWLLPVAGLVLGGSYERYGSPIRGGSDLVLDTIHERRPQLPLRMAPMVAMGTVLTHLFGGSAGREGTAVQMGASLADFVAHRARVDSMLRRQLLVAGVAGGFGAVFGTPLAGLVFGLEYVTVGRYEWRAAVPALVASVVGDRVTRALGIEHSAYPYLPWHAPSIGLLGKWVVFAVVVAGLAVTFLEGTHALKKLGARVALPWRMAVGGAVVVAMWQAVGSDVYLGLGVPTILTAFEAPLPTATAAWKLLFTAVTLGSGYLGGEVTPLFFVGATAGNALAGVLDLPLGLAAGVGMAALFGAAANTPIALAVMAAELLGIGVFPHALFVTLLACLATGRRGLYASQRMPRGKLRAWF